LTATVETTAQALRATALPPLPAPDASVAALLRERVRLAAARYAEQHGGEPGAPRDVDAAGDVWVLDVAGWPIYIRTTTGAAAASSVNAEGEVTVVVVTLDPAAPAGPSHPAPAVVFHAFVELLQAEIARTNRRWRRVLAAAVGGDTA
jgi:hypothetical protein